MADREEEPKSECPRPPEDRSKWHEWVETELKPWAWRGGRMAQYLLETDPAKRAAVTPNGLTATRRFKNNMSVFNELKRLFYQEFKTVFDGTAMVGDFATATFNTIEQERSPRFYSDIRTKLDELAAAYRFDGDARKFFRTVHGLTTDLGTVGHAPNDAEVTQSCIRAIYLFAHRKESDDADRLWAQWLTNYEDMTPAPMINFTTLRSSMQNHVDRYENRKKEVGGDNNLANFYVGGRGCKDGSSRYRQRDESDHDDGPAPRGRRMHRHSPYGRRDADRGGRDADRGGRDAGSGGRDAGRGGRDAGRGGRDADRDGRDASYRSRDSRRRRDHSRSPSNRRERNNEVRTRAGEFVRCKLCLDNHFMDKCPYLPEVQQIFAQRRPSRGFLTCMLCRGPHRLDDCAVADEARAMVRTHRERGGSRSRSNRRKSRRALSPSRSRSRSRSRSTSRRRGSGYSTYDSKSPKRSTSRRRASTPIPYPHFNMHTAVRGETEIKERGVVRNFLFAAMTVLWTAYSMLMLTLASAEAMVAGLAALITGSLRTKTLKFVKATAAVIAAINPRRKPPPPYLPIRLTTPDGTKTVYAATQPRTDPALALVNIITTAAINTLLGGTAQRKSALRANLEKGKNDPDDDIPDDLPPLKRGQRYFICDSGANRHYHPTDEFIFRKETIKHPIGGLTDGNQATTDKYGIFCANLEDDRGRLIPITSVAFSVPGARVGLFSEVQATFAGNTIIREGHPETGVHGIQMRSADGKSKHGPFIPLHFSKKTLLWYIKICPPDPFQCAHARRLDPIDLARRGF